MRLQSYHAPGRVHTRADANEKFNFPAIQLQELFFRTHFVQKAVRAGFACAKPRTSNPGYSVGGTPNNQDRARTNRVVQQYLPGAQ